jgi:hypothetical protein
MKIYGGVDVEPHLPDLGTGWRWVASFTPLPLYPWGKSHRYPLDRRLSGPPEPVWMTWRTENSFPNLYSNSNTLVVQHVASHYTNYAIPALRKDYVNWKNPNTSSGIVPMTFQLVAQCLNHYATMCRWSYFIASNVQLSLKFVALFRDKYKIRLKRTFENNKTQK